MKKPITIAVLLALALTVLFSLCAFAVNAETFLLGDVNGNGKIDAQDYAMCKRAFLRTFSLNGAQLARADINGNGKVDASEYAMIKRHFLGTYDLGGATVETGDGSLYDRTEEGGLLYSVDFRGDDVFRPELTYTYQPSWGESTLKTVSEDGKSLAIKGCSFVSGQVGDLPLDGEHSYTISYTAEFSSSYIVIQGLYIDLDEQYSYGTTSGKIGYNGFRSAYNSYAFAQDGFNYAIGGSEYMFYASDPAAGVCPYTEPGTPQNYLGTDYPTVRHKYKLVADGAAETLDYYVLAVSAKGGDPVWKLLYRVCLKDVGSSFKSEHLQLAFQSYYFYDSLSVVYSDAAVYKGFAKCGAETETEEGDEAIPGEEHRVSADTSGITVLGVRNLAAEDCVNLDWSCSGVSFEADTKAAGISFSVRASAPCLFRVWVDGEEYPGDSGVYHTVSPSKKCIVLADLPAGRHSVKLMKVTGYTLARTELEYIKMDGEIVAGDPVRKSRYVEFVGDSITCGWGTICGHTGAYTDQDGTLAYSYLLARELDADYSMTALSGQGLLTGDPGFPKGYLYASALKNDSVQYGFGREADLTVVLLGPGGVTSDFDKQKLIAAYASLINLIKEKNGADSPVLCLYNPMTDYYTESLLAACEQCGGEANGVYSFMMARAAGNAHPSQTEHAAYCEALLPVVRALLGETG